jgi:hypothetical protein
MAKFRNIVIAVAFFEFVAAGLMAGARAGDIGCVGAAGKVEQSAGVKAVASPYAVCSDMPSACSP